MLPETSSSQWYVGLSNRSMFVGRQKELQQLDRLMQVPRTLLTVYGTPGVGKSSLCAQWAAQTPLPVLPLSQGSSSVHLWQSLGQALDLRQPESSKPLSPEQTQSSILNVLAHRDPCVLWCDGFNAQSHDLATLVGWLREAPQHRILLTGHRRMQVPGEHGMELRGLPLEDAISWFETCAREVSVDFELDDATHALVQQIAQRLDCNPLALEIVASQLLLYGLPRLMERLDGSLLDMQSAWPDQPKQQRSLRAALMPVWEELEHNAHLLMFVAAQWRSGVTLNDMERVFDHLDISPDIFGAALALRSRALLKRLETPSGERFSLNAMIRELTLNQFKVDAHQREEIIHACILCMIENTQQATTDATQVRTVETRANLDRHVRDLSAYFDHHTLGVDALLASQRAHRLLNAMTPRDDTMYHALLKHDTRQPSSLREVAVRFEVLWMEKRRGRTDLAQLDALFEHAQALDASQWCGEVARLRAACFLASGELAHAVDAARTALSFFEIAHDTASAAHARYLLVSHQLALMSAGHDVDLDQLTSDLEDQRRASSLLGGYFDELYQCNVAFFAFFSGDYTRAVELARQGIERASQGHEPLMTIRWTQYYHYWLSRIGADPDLIITVGDQLIERCIQQAVPIATTVVVQSMSLQALGRVAQCQALLKAYDVLLDREVKADTVTGTLEVNRATNALILGQTALARIHLKRAVDAFDDHVLPVNSLVLAMFTGVADVLDLEMSMAHQSFERARQFLEQIAPAYREERAIALELCESLQTRHPALIDAVLATYDGHDARIIQLTRALVRGAVSHLDTADHGHVDFHMATDGSWFEARDADRVDISKRVALPLILSALVHLHKTAPGDVLSMYELIDIGWPDESLDLDSGTNRVRAAIYALRSLGLRDVLINQQGYLLKPSTVIVTR